MVNISGPFPNDIITNCIPVLSAGAVAGCPGAGRHDGFCRLAIPRGG